MVRNSREQLISALKSIESKLPVDKWQVNNIHVWPIIKRDLSFHIINSFEGITADKENNNKKIKIFLLGLKEAFRILILKKKYNTVFFSHVVYLRDKIEGKSYNKFFDPIMDELDSGNSIQVELDTSPYSNAYKRKRILKIGYLILLIEKFNKYRLRKFLRYTSCFLPEIQRIPEILIENKINLEVRPILEEGFLKRRVFYISSQIPFFRNLLKKLKPNNVGLVCYYSRAEIFALTYSAKAMGLKSFDIQHGPMNGMHPLYANYEKTPYDGYNTITDAFLCWREVDVVTIKQNNSKDFNTKHESIKLGHPWVYFINKLDFKYDVQNKIALFSAQPLDDPFTENLLTLIKNTKDEMNWYIRLHPRQLMQLERIKQFFKDKGLIDFINIEDASKLPLPVILKNTILHVTMYSGVSIEANMFGIPTIFMDERGIKGNKNMIEEGMGFAFRDIDQLPIKEDNKKLQNFLDIKLFS